MKLFSINIFILLLLLVFNVSVSNASEDLFPQIGSDDDSGLNLIKIESYGPKTLWDYMDGGADLYLEYGFDSLQIKYMQFDGKEFIVEIYKMKDQGAAVGIFTSNKIENQYKDTLLPDIPEFLQCSSSYQYQAVCGFYYFRIINSNGTPEEIEAGKEIAGFLIKKMDNLKIDNPFKVDEDKGRNSTLKYLCGKIAVGNNIPSLSKYLDSLKFYSVTFIKHSISNEIYSVGFIVFKNAEENQAFLKKINYTANNPNEWSKLPAKTKTLYIKPDDKNALINIFIESAGRNDANLDEIRKSVFNN